MLKVEDIDVLYGDLQVLWEVSFEVCDGEILILVGANDAGKSTTLKTISSLLKPQQGKILFEGEQQMVPIGRGLMGLPKLLMFDEPLLGLSPLLVEHIFDLVTKVNKEGLTVLLVEQNMHHTLGHMRPGLRPGERPRRPVRLGL